MRISKEVLVNSAPLNYLSESAYDYTKWNLGKGLIYNAGGTAVDKYIAPQFSVIRPMEESTAFAVSHVYTVSFSATIDYVFGIENSTTASATRRIHLWTVNKKTGAVSWNGFITMTYGSATAHTIRDFKIDRKLEISGTVGASGTAVTGVDTAFATNKVAIGARIGFGSTDPSQITTWYRIATRTSDTALVLATSAGTVTAGTAYVIEEYRPVALNTNATTTNGGIHYGKGISIEDFTSGGTTIAAAVATDDQKAIYWIKDASTQTNIVAAGMAIDFASATATSLDTYVLDLVSAGNYKFYKYNLRTALTVATGATTSCFVLATGNNPFTGTGSQNANLSIATASHGTGSGVKSLYMVTTTRLYRVPVTQITTTSTTVFSAPSDNIAEIPTGGTNTFAATSALSTVEYSTDSDTFIVGTTHTAGTFSYITQYVASGQQFQKVFGRDYKYLEQSTKNSNHPSLLSNQSTVFSWFNSSNSNLIYATKQGTTTSTNAIYVMALNADWDYAVNTTGRLISPEISSANALKYYRVFANNVCYIGSSILGKVTEPFRIYARTANIRTDATSGWTLIDETNDLSGFAGAANIQYALEFKTLGESCIPSRILGVNFSYEDTLSDSHFSLSVGKSSLASKIFAFWFKTAFGTAVPSLTITLYNASTGALLLTDDTVTPTNGTFEKTTDGTTWTAYNTTDKSNETTWIRYTPTSLADNIKVEAYLTLT